jgi:uncharacterized protein (DUF2461 family)
VTQDGAATCYVSLSAEGLFVGAGMYHLMPDQLARFRDAVADDATGSTVAEIAADLEGDGYELGAAESLKSAPRGWDPAHPRIELVRRKGLVTMRSFPRAKWQSTAKALDRITGVWNDAAPLNDWLEVNVGPTTMARGRT